MKVGWPMRRRYPVFIVQRLSIEILGKEFIDTIIGIKAEACGEQERGFRSGLLKISDFHARGCDPLELLVPQIVENRPDIHEVGLSVLAQSPRVPIEAIGWKSSVLKLLHHL